MSVYYEFEAANSSDDVLATRASPSRLEIVNIGFLLLEYLKNTDDIYDLDEFMTSVFETALLPECSDVLPQNTSEMYGKRFDAIVAFCEISPLQFE